MERITQKDGLFGEVFASCTRQDLVNQLYEYEETGFSPEEILEMNDYLLEMEDKYYKSRKELSEIRRIIRAL